jgi:hypothetical protein
LTSKTTARFRSALSALPEHVQERARAAFRQFQQDPTHPSLRFKQVHAARPIFSARVGLGYRALAIRDDQVYIWFWIGTHGDYDKLLKQL